jgi:hypothetical protein
MGLPSLRDRLYVAYRKEVTNDEALTRAGYLAGVIYAVMVAIFIWAAGGAKPL